MYEAINYSPKEYIKANQEALMERFLGIAPDSKIYRSPFRKDRKPTCSFYKSSTGTLYFKDWGTDEVYSVIDVIRQRMGVTYAKAVELAMKEAISTTPQFISKPKIFSFVPINDYHPY